MKKMILWTIVLLGPLTWTTTASAIFGIPDVAALAQRVTIIANQGIQIGHAVTGLRRATEQFNKLKQQYDHLREQALGEIGALTAPLTEIAALPGQLVGAGLTWRDDFTHTDAAGLVDALDLFSNDGQPLTDYWRDRLNARRPPSPNNRSWPRTARSPSGWRTARRRTTAETPPPAHAGRP